ncbi:CDP-alcohol phosphatidyltransferase family protein [Calycomorphotria hydatis]|uniref:CDP-alcohol phosphatidyltransferase n=1 Tax=Calycomorphotria hydatis TaxID=2528027 RepID=A0A517T617_9PLAN|nr:CDP-alcohol phosphatidyltransferase family protein [Calycomorphotria hydatis]QDT63819.1 CDP-alcohol phosphatidyltransferase [Calycomorphotria hydatis]
MRRFPIIPTVLSLGNAICGITAIWLLCGPGFYRLDPQVILPLTSGIILLAAVFDALDGIVSRLMDQETNFGRFLDAGCDLISFAIAPAVICFSVIGVAAVRWWGWMPGDRVIVVAVITLYVMAAVIRLAIDVSREEDRNWFQGMPLPLAGLIVVGAAYLFAQYLDPTKVIQIPFLQTLAMGRDRWILYSLLGTLVISSLLMLLPIPFPHPFRWLHTRFRRPKYDDDYLPMEFFTDPF